MGDEKGSKSPVHSPDGRILLDLGGSYDDRILLAGLENHADRALPSLSLTSAARNKGPGGVV
jgi:hypothetical protein